MTNPASFTGRRRKRTTHWTVALVDRIAKTTIAIGGIGTIVAVSLVCVFLVWTVIPLFLPASSGTAQQLSAKWSDANLLALGVDDYNQSGWAISKDGLVQVFRLDNGEVVEQLSGDKSPIDQLSAVSAAIDGESAAFGFADGKVSIGRINYQYKLTPTEDVPEDLRALPFGQVAKLPSGELLTRTEQGQLRRQSFKIEAGEKLAIGGGSAIELLDHVQRGEEHFLCSRTADGKLRFSQVSSTIDLLSDEKTLNLESAELPLPTGITSPPTFLLVTELGDNVFAAWPDGRLARYETRRLKESRLVEEVDLVPEPGHQLTRLEFLLGRTTLLAGDTLGRVRAWFTVLVEEDDRIADETVPADRRLLVPAHQFPGSGQAVTALAPSPRSRLAAVGFADGSVRLLFVAGGRKLANLQAGDGTSVAQLAVSPKGDGLLAATTGGITRWTFDARHPEASLRTLFLPVWFEGRTGPEHVWQTTGSSDASEAKFGLVPLVFGTLKATFYTMIFGAPLALLAAIYSSEFLHPRIKARVKPTIEMMASLPSVVLGFLAGLVLAPFIEGIVPEVLTCIFTVPLAFMTGAYLWQLLPSDTAVRMSRFRLIFILVALPVGIYFGAKLGPLVEKLLFAGNIKEWLDGQRGNGIGGWMLLLLPLSGIFTAVLCSQQVNPWLRRHSAGWSRQKAGLMDLAKFAGAVCFTLLVAFVVAWALDQLKLDPRGSFVGTYVQRNSLVVGFAMAFAIIPLIYTIADDALSTVPSHLRSASLGAGATPWQTAVRIVIPTAMSGLFSAVMIGLGRAVGETMIVLMGAGNTPEMTWNMFSGFQTLSMAIATELPEAPAGSTHYRVLFLAALTLFVFTFFINSIAEVIRQRFRRRAYEL